MRNSAKDPQEPGRGAQLSASSEDDYPGPATQQKGPSPDGAGHGPGNPGQSSERPLGPEESARVPAGTFPCWNTRWSLGVWIVHIKYL